MRKKRVDLVSADAAMANGKPSDNPKGNVDVILEVEERDWSCWVDAGGMKRVLLNILGVSRLVICVRCSNEKD